MVPENWALMAFVVCMVVGVVIFGAMYWLKMRHLKEVHDENVANANRNFSVLAENELVQKREMSALRGELGKLDGGLSSSSVEVDRLNTVIGKVDQELGDVSGSVTALSTLQGRVAGLEGGMGVVASEVEDLKSQFGAYVKDTGGNMYVMGGRLGVAESNVGVLGGRLDGVDAKLGTFGGLMNSYSNSLVSMVGTQTTLSNELGVLDGRVGSINGVVTGLSGKINDVERGFAGVSTRIDGLNTMYASVASVGALSNQMTMLNGMIGQANTRVAAMSNEYYVTKTSWERQFNLLSDGLKVNNDKITTSNLTVRDGSTLNYASVSNMLRVGRDQSDRWPGGWGAGVHANNMYLNNALGMGSDGALRTTLGGDGSASFGGNVTMGGNATVAGDINARRNLSTVTLTASGPVRGQALMATGGDISTPAIIRASQICLDGNTCLTSAQLRRVKQRSGI